METRDFEYEEDQILPLDPREYQLLLEQGFILEDNLPPYSANAGLIIVYCRETQGQRQGLNWKQLSTRQVNRDEGKEVGLIIQTAVLVMCSAGSDGKTLKMQIVGAPFQLSLLNSIASSKSLELQLVKNSPHPPRSGSLVEENLAPFTTHANIFGVLYSDDCPCCHQTYALVTDSELRGFIRLEAGTVDLIRCRPSNLESAHSQ